MELGQRVNVFARVVRGVCCVSTGDFGLKIAEIEVADDTASIRVKLKNEQCKLAVQNSTIVIRNALVQISGDYLRLEIDNHSNISQSSIGVPYSLKVPMMLNTH